MVDWAILGIKETKDEELITRAYREVLSVTNPEDDAEKFMRLRQAYEAAIDYARNDEKSDIFDDTPVGHWLEKVDEVYNDFEMRNSIEVWQELLADDVCVMLDTKIEARDKLLVYAMEHYYIPKKIWLLINDVFDIMDSEAELYEIFPREFIENAVINAIQYEDILNYDLFDMNAFIDYEDFLRKYYALSRIMREGDLEKIEAAINEIDEFGPVHPYIEMERSKFYIRVGRKEEAVQIMENLYNQYPTDETIIHIRAEVAYSSENYEDAMAYYQKLIELNPKHYYANVGYADCLMNTGKYAEAKERYIELHKEHPYYPYLKEAVEKANISLIEEFEKNCIENPEDMKAKVELGWCYLQNDRIEDAYKVAVTVSPDYDAYEYYNLIGRCCVYRNDTDNAIIYIEKWIEAIHNTVDDGSKESKKRIDRLYYAYELLGEVYAMKKDYDMAYAMVEKAMEINPKDTGPLELLNKIYLDKKEYSKCMEICDRILELEKDAFSAYHAKGICLYETEVYMEAYENFEKALEIFPYNLQPYLYKIKILIHAEQYDKANEIIEYLKTQDLGSEMLEFLDIKNQFMKLIDGKEIEEKERFDRIQGFKEQLKVIIGKYEEDKSDIFDADDLYYEYANCALTISQEEDALPYIQKGIEINPDNANLLNCLSYTYKELKQYKEAIDVYKKMLEHVPDHSMANYRIADCYEKLGDYESAVEYHKKQVAVNRGQYFYLSYGLAYLELSRYDEAREVFVQAIELYPQSPHPYNDMGMTYLYEENYDEALRYFKRAVDCFGVEKSAVPYRNMATVYARLREYDKAIECYEENFKIFNEIDDLKEIADLYKYSNRYKESVEVYSKYCKEHYSDKVEGRIELLTWVAYTNQDLGAEKTAIKYYKKAIEEAKKNGKSSVMAYKKLAFLYYIKDNFEKACEFYSKANKLDSHCLDFMDFLYYARSLKKMNRIKEYMELMNFIDNVFENIIFEPARSTIYVCYKAFYYLVRGEYEKSIQLYSDALRGEKCYYCMFGKCHDALHGLATVYEDMAMFDEAKQYEKQALATKPSDCEYIYGYRRIQEKLEKNNR